MSNDLATTIDFKKVLSTANELLREQALVDGKDVSLETIELTKAKASSFLDALNNSIHVAHLAEIMRAQEKSFKRDEELLALNPLLTSFQLAAKASEMSMQYLVKKLEWALNEEELDPVIMGHIQEAYANAISNVTKVTAGITRLIQLERFSGARAWGNTRSSPNAIGYVKGLGGDDEGGKKKPRKITREELDKMYDE